MNRESVYGAHPKAHYYKEKFLAKSLTICFSDKRERGFRKQPSWWCRATFFSPHHYPKPPCPAWKKVQKKKNLPLLLSAVSKCKRWEAGPVLSQRASHLMTSNIMRWLPVNETQISLMSLATETLTLSFSVCYQRARTASLCLAVLLYFTLSSHLLKADRPFILVVWCVRKY